MTLIRDLSPEREAALKTQAQEQGVTADEWLRRVVEERLQGLTGQPAQGPGAGKDDRPVWEVVLDEMKDVPPEAFASLPKDGASQIDHYIYGLPKREA